jgi:hypothetical protein
MSSKQETYLMLMLVAQEMETLLQRLLCDYYFILLFYYSVVDLQGTCIIQDDKLTNIIGF